MSLRETTRTIIKQVEDHSGYPVQVLDDPKLDVFATVRLARGPMPAHMVLYRKIDNQDPDYYVVYQCGFVLRRFANPPDKRFDLTATELGHEQSKKLVMAEIAPRYGLTAQQAALLRDELETLPEE